MGSEGHLEQDAQTFAEWGITYVKMDFCGNNASLCGNDGQYCYQNFSQALNATGKRIMFHMCSWGTGQPNNWTTETANLWRTSADGQGTWESYMRSFDNTLPMIDRNGPGSWSLADGLFFDRLTQLSATEKRTLLSLWAMIPVPMLVNDYWPSVEANGSNVANYTDSAFLSIHQDPLGKPMRKIYDSQPGGIIWASVWARPLADGRTYAVLLFNRGDWGAAPVPFMFSAIGTAFSDNRFTDATLCTVSDVYNSSNSSVAKGGFTELAVPNHGSTMLRVTLMHQASTQKYF